MDKKYYEHRPVIGVVLGFLAGAALLAVIPRLVDTFWLLPAVAAFGVLAVFFRSLDPAGFCTVAPRSHSIFRVMWFAGWPLLAVCGNTLNPTLISGAFAYIAATTAIWHFAPPLYESQNHDLEVLK